jgi:hypothetical protein
MTKAACLLRHAKISGIDETDKLRRFVINPDIGVGWICRAFPEFGMLGPNMCRLFSQTEHGITAVTISAAKHYVRSFMHGFDTLMTLEASSAFCVCLCLGLIDPIVRRTFHRLR